MTKEEKTLYEIEKFILQLKLKLFHKSSITDHHFRDKRSLVDTALTNLVQRRLLHMSEDKKPFFSTRRVSPVTTYLKYLPTPDDEERFRDILLKSFSMKYDKYKQIFFDSSLLPPGGQLTSYGSDLICRSQYHTNDYNEGKSVSDATH